MHLMEIIAVSSNYVPGYSIKKVIMDLHWGISAASRGALGTFMANIRALFGGEIDEYTMLLGKARNDALNRLMSEAAKVGANAIVDVRFDTSHSTITPITRFIPYLGAFIGSPVSVAEIVAYGTAVIIEKDLEFKSASLR